MILWFSKGFIVLLLTWVTSAQLIRSDFMNIGVYNPETKQYEKAADHQKQHTTVLGGDGHDTLPHGHILGGDDHDKLPHGQILGRDNHDKLPHGHILGGDDHDKLPHSHILGGDDHDKLPHGQVLGRDGHESRPHGQLLGRDGHDSRPHEQILGRDGHDNRPHGQLLGRDGHDNRPHMQVLGRDGHDNRPHGELLGRDGHDNRPHGQLLGRDGHDNRPHMQVLGRDGHDNRPHMQVLGIDGHDNRPHGQLLGRDGNDNRPHMQVLGRDGHDNRPHGQLLGRDGHDNRLHQQLLGRDGHDNRPHQQLLGRDGHDNRPHQQLLGRDGHDYLQENLLVEHAQNGHSRGHLGGKNLLKHIQRVGTVSAFKTFMEQHNRSYSGQAEFRNRFSIFRQNLHRIRQMQRAERGSATYGITQFADLSDEEFRKLLGFRPELRRPSVYRRTNVTIPDIELPESFDWRDHGIVTPVKNQGSCGSCWAFSTTGNVEGQWALKNKDLISLSEQELMDCDTVDQSCEGGLPENAYEAIIKMGGLETENDYPYEGHDSTCHKEDDKAKVTVTGSVELPEDETELAKWIVKNGPVSIGINANALQFYMGGVSHPLKFLCRPSGIDHGMLIVGFGTHKYPKFNKILPFWVVKNSWGSKWGEQGYYRVYRGDGTCGLNKMVTSAVV